ncbi:RagB/SusD family nutrient uptake outer membrane protein [Chitinophaga lutea]|uniref:RagB/SusD family nutrient uptake outer membrane protein n=1 Tax=Chitinophaga lutea TaxID=2488634 RepID=A0A3N4PUY2_9BACT|nr:RagB/SusD family nutrient uptake outer membrane protein [Chitinophaga lutea]RPE07967.1 RagB/SusD family nutrient uptake outer membrane protein [Chitinophaga lutea]
MIRIYFVLLVLCCTGCKKFLDTNPTDFLTPDQYFNTEEQLKNGLTGVYDILGSSELYSNNFTSRTGTEADQGFYARSTFNGPQVYTHTASDNLVTGTWQKLYEGISRANLVLASIDKPKMGDSARSQIRGEALFLRSFYYFMLVSNWGDVPLILQPVKSAAGNDIARTPAKDVYEQVVKDMKEAETLVPTITTMGYGGRITKSAVRGMLARVYLYWAGKPLNDVSKYNDAREWALKVIESGEHKLADDYTQVFINYAQDKYDIKESIWEVEFWGNRVGNAYTETGWIGYTVGIATTDTEIGFSYGFINATARLYRMYENGDVRRDWAIAPYRYSGKTKVNHTAAQLYNRNAAKWRREYETLLPKGPSSTPQNFPILRYSDVLLMFAEAENAVNGPTAAAIAAANLVRKRAKAPEYTTFASKEAFLEELQDERSRELCFEALRKPDLIRWGIFLPTMQQVANEIQSEGGTYVYATIAFLNVSEKHLLFPVPAREMMLNRKLVQNPGW